MYLFDIGIYSGNISFTLGFNLLFCFPQCLQQVYNNYGQIQYVLLETESMQLFNCTFKPSSYLWAVSISEQN